MLCCVALRLVRRGASDDVDWGKPRMFSLESWQVMAELLIVQKTDIHPINFIPARIED